MNPDVTPLQNAANQAISAGIGSHIVDLVWAFITSPAFFVSIGMFLVWVLAWRLARWTFSWIVAICNGILTPAKWLRLSQNLFGLVCMVGGVAGAAAAYARLTNGNAPLQSTIAGGIALGVWGMVMLTTHQVERFLPSKKSKKSDEK